MKIATKPNKRPFPPPASPLPPYRPPLPPCRLPAPIPRSRTTAGSRRPALPGTDRTEAGGTGGLRCGLPGACRGGLFPDFRHTIAYLDIETTGLGDASAITTIVVYDGETIRHYVNGENLDAFPHDIKQYGMIVTYNGKCFDVPVIERFFHMKMPQAHIDLRYVLKRLGYAGRLKGCEQQLGIARKDLADVDGFFAVLLWDDFVRTKNPEALETLLAYNTADVVNLETLLVLAYNLYVQHTPFGASYRQPLPTQPALPFRADRATIDRLKRQMPGAGGGYG